MAGFGLLILALCFLEIKFNNAQTFVYSFCFVDYEANTTFDTNLNILLSSMSTANNTRTIAATVGKEPDTIFGIFMCRGDLSSKDCKKCVETATRDIKIRCPYKREIYIWYDECLLRYNNHVNISAMVMDPKRYISFAQDVTDGIKFTEKVNELMNDLVSEAVNTVSMFAVGVANVTVTQRIYGLVQCTQDISFEDCDRCLRVSINQIPQCCESKDGGRILKPSCVLWFEVYKFFQSNGSFISTPTLTNIPPGNEKKSFNIVIAIESTVLGVVALSIFVISCFLMKHRICGNNNADVNGIPTAESLQFNFGVISSATDNFSDAKKLGQGGFGVVYKGVLSDGREIAVKRLSTNSVQGLEEFKNEVLLLAKLQHRNLVQLLGFSLQGVEKLLIYEYVPNASLDNFIFDEIKRRELNWDRRYRIIGGIARGLLYLHEDSRARVIHRDLKGSNVLIDEQMLPKICDFGLARLFEVDQTQGRTTRIVGTYGYMAPEYAMYGHFSVKSDVFSFGVVVLEIITGQKNNRFDRGGRAQDLLSYVWRHWHEGSVLELIEPTLGDQYSTTEVMRCLHMGLLCVQEDVERRPTMTSVVLMLSSHSITLSLPSTPAYFSETVANENMRIEMDKAQTAEPTGSGESSALGTTNSDSVNAESSVNLE